MRRRQGKTRTRRFVVVGLLLAALLLTALGGVFAPLAPNPSTPSPITTPTPGGAILLPQPTVK